MRAEKLWLLLFDQTDVRTQIAHCRSSETLVCIRYGCHHVADRKGRSSNSLPVVMGGRWHCCVALIKLRGQKQKTASRFFLGGF